MNAKQRKRIDAHAGKLARKGRLKEGEVKPWYDKAAEKNTASRIKSGQTLIDLRDFDPKAHVERGPVLHLRMVWVIRKRNVP